MQEGPPALHTAHTHTHNTHTHTHTHTHTIQFVEISLSKSWFHPQVYLLALHWLISIDSEFGRFSKLSWSNFLSYRNTHKILLEKSWHYLNADSLLVKFWAKMTLWRAFEVGRRIAVGQCRDQSKIFRLTPAVGAAGRIAMGTWYSPTASARVRRGTELSSRERTSSVAALQTKERSLFAPTSFGHDSSPGVQLLLHFTSFCAAFCTIVSAMTTAFCWYVYRSCRASRDWERRAIVNA